jgi:hypothetical protein
LFCIRTVTREKLAASRRFEAITQHRTNVLGNAVLTPKERMDLTDPGACCGEEIAQALCLISLGADEKILTLEMVGVFQGGGKSLILASIVFKAQGFCLEGAIEAWADFVGFAIEVQDGSFFSAFGGLG